MNNFDINSLLSSFGFFYITQGQVIMLFVGLILLYLAINKKFEPLLLVPIGFGTILSNIPEIGLAYSGLEKIIFENDPETDAIVMIGEIGGSMEIEAAEYVKDHVKKPVVGFIAGETAPPGRRMGHAGAIVSGADESAAAKKAIMRKCGINVVDSPADIGKTVKKALAVTA